MGSINFASFLNPLNVEFHPICHLLALLGAHRILHISRIRVKCVTYFIKILDVNNDLQKIRIFLRKY